MTDLCHSVTDLLYPVGTAVRREPVRHACFVERLLVSAVVERQLSSRALAQGSF